jgi:predicted NACHT family NTPase
MNPTQNNGYDAQIAGARLKIALLARYPSKSKGIERWSLIARAVKATGKIKWDSGGSLKIRFKKLPFNEMPIFAEFLEIEEFWFWIEEKEFERVDLENAVRGINTENEQTVIKSHEEKIPDTESADYQEKTLQPVDERTLEEKIFSYYRKYSRVLRTESSFGEAHTTLKYDQITDPYSFPDLEPEAEELSDFLDDEFGSDNNKHKKIMLHGKLSKLLKKVTQSVLLGEPGSGKSTFLKREFIKSAENYKAGGKVHRLVFLRNFSDKIQLWDLLCFKNDLDKKVLKDLASSRPGSVTC